MYVFAETRTNEEKEIYEVIWVRKFYLKNEKERGVLETLIWIFTRSHNVTAAAFLYIIPYITASKEQSTSRIELFVSVVSPYTFFLFFILIETY